MMSTGSIATYSACDRIGGVAGLAVRAGQALEHWGRRTAQPITRDQLERQIATEREARAGAVLRSELSSGAYQLLR
jgi:hypothetical protein